MTTTSTQGFGLRPLSTLGLVVALATGCTSGGLASTDDDPAVEDDDGGVDTETGTETTALDAPALPAEPYNYREHDYPAHFSANFNAGPFNGSVLDQDNEPADNRVSDAGATLGRVLFYDRQLSQNGTKACASCHIQDKGFSDNEVLSEGFEGGLTGRRSMGLANARFYARGHFFWDERADTLEDQVLMPLQDPVEMGMTLEEVVARVDARDFYAPLFEAAFGDEEVTSDRIARALAQFVRSLVSYESRYDEQRAQAGSLFADFPGFTAEENLGKRIFFGPGGNGPPGACGGCHVTDAMIQPAPFNNGLDTAEDSTDHGVFEVEPAPNNLDAFKSPSLRNIAVRAPYMHDGRFDTLQEVVDHYSDDVQAHPNLGPGLRGPNGQPQPLDLTGEEKQAVIAFLETLTDEAFLTDPRYADPFQP